MLGVTFGGVSVVAASPLTRMAFDWARDTVKRKQDLGDKDKGSVTRQIAELREEVNDQAVKLARIETKSDLTHEAISDVRELVNTLIAKL